MRGGQHTGKDFSYHAQMSKTSSYLHFHGTSICLALGTTLNQVGAILFLNLATP
jgi:hypothetical protein